MVEADTAVKTTDGYLLRLFCIGFAAKRQRQTKNEETTVSRPFPPPFDPEQRDALAVFRLKDRIPCLAIDGAKKAQQQREEEEASSRQRDRVAPSDWLFYVDLMRRVFADLACSWFEGGDKKRPLKQQPSPYDNKPGYIYTLPLPAHPQREGCSSCPLYALLQAAAAAAERICLR